MDDIKLTKDADYLLCSLYRFYLQRRSYGVSKQAALHTGGSEDIQNQLFPQWDIEDVDAICRELCEAHMLDGYAAENMIYDASLTFQAIAYMENRFKRNALSLLNHIEKVKSTIPFI